MRSEPLKIPNLIDDEDETRSSGVAAVALALTPIENEATRSEDYAALWLWGLGTFAALLAAETHGAALALTTFRLSSQGVIDLSALVAALSIIVGIIAASVALRQGWRYLERSTFFKFALALVPSMFAGQVAAWLAATAWTEQWFATWWDVNAGAFSCGEMQAEFGALLAVGGLVGAVAANVWVVRRWDDESEWARPRPIPWRAAPAPKNNKLN